MKTTYVIAAIATLTATAAFSAGPWYVAKEDANAADTLVDGRGTESLPFRTIQAELDNPACESGDTVYVKRGVYDEGMKYSNFSNFNMTNRVFITKPTGWGWRFRVRSLIRTSEIGGCT